MISMLVPNFKILLLLMVMYSFTVHAQKGDESLEIQSIRAELIKFLQEQGELDTDKSADYLNSHLNIFEVKKREPLGFSEVGIFGFRSSNAPSVTYLLLKDHSKRKILDVQEISTAMSEVLQFLNDHSFPNSEIAGYCEEILNIYKYNRYDSKSKM